MKNNILSAIALTLILSGCSSLLEEKAYSSYSADEYYKTENQVKLATNGVYEVLKNLTGSIQFIGNVGTDEARQWRGNIEDRTIDTYNINQYTKMTETLWEVLYRGINRANSVIEGIENSPLPHDTRQQYIAEMRFMRGFYYYYLVRFFGEVPLKLYRTDSYSTAFAPKASVEKIYEAIVDDFKAGDILPEKYEIGGIGRATCGAARAFLASARLSMTGFPLYKNTAEDYQKVIDAAQSVIDLADSGVYKLVAEYKNLFATADADNENNSESIFEFQAGFVAQTGGHAKNLMGVVAIWPVVYHKNNNNVWPDSRAGRANIRPVWKFVDSYQSGDKRRDHNISDYILQGADANGTDRNTLAMITQVKTKPFVSRTDQGISKYRFPTSWDVSKFAEWDNPLNWVFMRYSEILLIMAEAQYMVGGYDACKEYLEPLAMRAGVPVWDGEGLIEERILLERSWELCFESKRWFDLQRLDKLYDYVSTRDSGYAIPYETDFYKADITPGRKYYDIPQSELDYNTAL